MKSGDWLTLVLSLIPSVLIATVALWGEFCSVRVKPTPLPVARVVRR